MRATKVSTIVTKSLVSVLVGGMIGYFASTAHSDNKTLPAYTQLAMQSVDHAQTIKDERATLRDKLLRFRDEERIKWQY